MVVLNQSKMIGIAFILGTLVLMVSYYKYLDKISGSTKKKIKKQRDIKWVDALINNILQEELKND